MTPPIPAATLVPDPHDPADTPWVLCPCCRTAALLCLFVARPGLPEGCRLCLTCRRVVDVAAAIGED